MVESCHSSDRDEVCRGRADLVCERVGRSAQPQGPLRHLARGEILFQHGDTRTRAYRVESGAVCHYMQWQDGRHEVIEFAFPGDIVGLGNLEQHISTAQAMLDTDVSLVSEADLAEVLRQDAELSVRLSAAADREFDMLKEKAVAAGRAEPLKRVASFLLAVASVNAREGRSETVVPDTLSCGVIAETLGLSVDTLELILVDLEKRQLVTPSSGGLRLNDVSALEALAA